MTVLLLADVADFSWRFSYAIRQLNPDIEYGPELNHVGRLMSNEMIFLPQPLALSASVAILEEVVTHETHHVLWTKNAAQDPEMDQHYIAMLDLLYKIGTRLPPPLDIIAKLAPKAENLTEWFMSVMHPGYPDPHISEFWIRTAELADKANRQSEPEDALQSTDFTSLYIGIFLSNLLPEMAHDALLMDSFLLMVESLLESRRLAAREARPAIRAILRWRSQQTPLVAGPEAVKLGGAA
jgi:hypothetical protein